MLFSLLLLEKKTINKLLQIGFIKYSINLSIIFVFLYLNFILIKDIFTIIINKSTIF